MALQNYASGSASVPLPIGVRDLARDVLVRGAVAGQERGDLSVHVRGHEWFASGMGGEVSFSTHTDAVGAML